MESLHTVKGFVAPGWEHVQQVFQENFTKRGEVGAALCVSLQGCVVVDLHGGLSAQARPDGTVVAKAWNEQTLVNVFSCCKAIANMCLCVSLDQQRKSLHEPVSRFWPAFAAAGKQNISIAQLLSHQAGLPFFDERVDLKLIEAAQYGICSVQGQQEEKLVSSSSTKRCGACSVCQDSSRYHAILEKQRPHWTVDGKTVGYHPLSVGLYVSALCPRVDAKQRSLRAVLRDTMNGGASGSSSSKTTAAAAAADMEFEFHMGMDKTQEHALAPRLARLYNVLLPDGCKEVATLFPHHTAHERLPGAMLDPTSMTRRAYAGVLGRFSPWKARHLEIPSALGFTNARALSFAFHGFALSAAPPHLSTRARQNQEVERRRGTGRSVPFLSLVSRSMAHETLEPAISGEDKVMFGHSTFSNAGFVLDPAAHIYPPQQSPTATATSTTTSTTAGISSAAAFFHGGAGGAVGLGDPSLGLGLGYVTNSLEEGRCDVRRWVLVQAVYATLDSLLAGAPAAGVDLGTALPARL